MFSTSGLSRRDINMTAVLAVIFFGMHAEMLWNEWAVDLSAYYYAGHFFQTGQFDQIYAGPPQIIGPEMPPAWEQAVAASGFAGEQTYPFIYLPWVAAVMGPLTTLFGPQALMNIVLLCNITMVLLSTRLAYLIVAPATTPVWLWNLISGALLINSSCSVLALSLGQVQILVFFLCLLAFERYKAGAFWIAGMALALAACLKITPAAFAIIFLWDRNWRALAGMGGLTLAMCLFSWVVVGPGLHEQYATLMNALNQQVFIAAISFSVEGFAYELADLWQGTAPIHVTHEYFHPKPAWIDQLAKGSFVVGLAAIWYTTRKLDLAHRLPRQLFALALLVPLAAPLGWVHYFLLATYLLPGMLEQIDRRLAIGLLAAFLVLLNVYTQVFLFLLLPLFIDTMRFFPQILLSVPLLVALLVSVVFFGRPPGASTGWATGAIRPGRVVPPLYPMPQSL